MQQQKTPFHQSVVLFFVQLSYSCQLSQRWTKKGCQETSDQQFVMYLRDDFPELGSYVCQSQDTIITSSSAMSQCTCLVAYHSACDPRFNLTVDSLCICSLGKLRILTSVPTWLIQQSTIRGTVSPYGLLMVVQMMAIYRLAKVSCLGWSITGYLLLFNIYQIWYSKTYKHRRSQAVQGVQVPPPRGRKLKFFGGSILMVKL